MESVIITVVVEARIPSSFSLWECQGATSHSVAEQKAVEFWNSRKGTEK
jgi:hypothetical protein